MNPPIPSPLFVYWSPIYIHNYSVSSSWIVASNWKFSFSYAWHCFFLYICIVYIQNFEYFCDFELTTHITVSVGEGIVASNSLDSSPFPMHGIVYAPSIWVTIIYKIIGLVNFHCKCYCVQYSITFFVYWKLCIYTKYTFHIHTYCIVMWHWIVL